MAKIIARAVGHGVMPVNLPLWMFRKVARMQKVDPYSLALLLHYIEDSKRGAFSYEGGVTRVMEELTGSPAESFETTARRYAALPFARQTLGNRLKAFLNFNLTPLYPGYDIKGYERRLELPIPAKPLYCMEDENWRRVRGQQMAEQRAADHAALASNHSMNRSPSQFSNSLNVTNNRRTQLADPVV